MIKVKVPPAAQRTPCCYIMRLNPTLLYSMKEYARGY